MSVRFDGTADQYLRAAVSSFGVTTGAYSIGGWIKIMSDINTTTWLFGFTDNFAASNVWFATSLDSTGTGIRSYGSSNNASYAASLSTWYYVVTGNNGSGATRCRVFDDSTSTTSLSDTSVGADDASAADSFGIGDFVDFWNCPDIEVACVRVHAGVYWTDAQCRTESQKLTAQTAGGTLWGNYKLEDTDADDLGINDSSGNGRHLTMNGSVVTGASRPSQLESSGGGSSILGRPAMVSPIGNYPVTLTPTGNRPFTYIR